MDDVSARIMVKDIMREYDLPTFDEQIREATVIQGK